jgi:hypothetical protein
MKLPVILDQVASFAAQEWRTTTTAVPAFFRALFDFAQTAPTNLWAMCAFTAAASIMVTLVTFYLWPKVEPAAPAVAVERELSGANGVWKLASRGLGAPDIARRTGMSHDAVATILRARPARTASGRKSRPTAA